MSSPPRLLLTRGCSAAPPPRRCPRRLPTAALVLVAALAGCDGEPPRRDCFGRVWVPTTLAGATVVGSWNDWAEPGIAPLPYDDRWTVARLGLPPGEHGYLIEHRGERFVDRHNPLTTFVDETEVSLLVVEDCAWPAVAWQRLDATADGDITVGARFLAADGGRALDPGRLDVRTSDGRALTIETADPESGYIEARGAGFGPGRHSVVISATDEGGRVAEAARGAVWIGARHTDWRDAVLYQVMLDRYRGDGGTALFAPATPGSRAGGTLSGLTAAVERGSFDELGVTALWLSPVYLNPTEARLGNDGRSYEGYHGYWPLDSRAVEPRLGGAPALDGLVAAAHARGIRVLLDLVPNHVYEDNPRYPEHRGDGWFTESCVCGQTSCPWGSHLQSCWFTPYLPDYRFQQDGLMGLAASDAEWWTTRFEADGVRIDAVPMMPRAATRRIAFALRRSTFPSREPFLLGEVYTGPGPGGVDQLRPHLGPVGFDSLFDFPLMWALRDAIASGRGAFGTVEDVLRYEEQSFAGSGAVLARMLDNHDTSRFVSVAHGDAGGDPWDEPAAQPADAEPYRRLQVAMAAIFTLPGMPLLYQGDEVGLAGAGDPDCRRVMPALEELSDLRLEVRRTVGRLANLRRCSAALRRGDRVAAVVRDRVYGYLRGSAEARPALVLLSAATEPTSVTLPAGTLPEGGFVDVVSGERFVGGPAGPISIDLPPLSYRIVLSDDDPCQW